MSHVNDSDEPIGSSQRPRKQWTKHGYKSQAFDVKLCRQHDLTTRMGFYILLDMLLSRLGQIIDSV